jgi:hypothetical protein
MMMVYVQSIKCNGWGTQYIRVSCQFDLESILHQAPPMVILRSQNSMGVEQKDELFSKLNTKRELWF